MHTQKYQLSSDWYERLVPNSSSADFPHFLGDCGFNGENCGTIEMTLINPTVSGGGSSADISYIPPLEFSVPYKFEYYGGCDGQGASCNSSDCSEAFYNPDETYVQVACQTDNVNLLITFCHGGDSANGTVATTSYSESVTTSETVSTFSTQITNAAASSPTASVDGDGTTMSVASSTVSSPFSISSSRRCRNRKRGAGRGLQSRAHRRRTRF
ncbi:hypothetical protein GYMLUDRAFT_156638 [Collybiopsis luxurians FD-317 M1]|nr:hypothetical protein GYMLUDRAFT_156638 [Collybiopsis luxurians FD-317 M1]